LIFLSLRSQGDADRAPLTHAKVLRSDVAVPTRWRSSRAPRATGSATATTSEAPRGAATATEPQQVATATTAVMTTAATAPSILPAPAPTGGPQVAVVEVPVDDAPPPGWD
jgi:hypothetical protein